MVPLSGEVSTSEAIIGGEGYNEFYYQSGAIAETHGAFITANISTGEQALFAFIGTSEERARWPSVSEDPTPGLNVRK
jgi:hypothetical protein